MRRIRAASRDESGYTILAVLALVVIVLAIGTAIAAATLSSSHFSNRDTRVRRAQQAADAGVQTQLYQQSEADLGSSSYNLNGGLLGSGVSVDCIVPTLNASLQISGLATASVSGTNACPQAQTGSGSATSYTAPLGNHSYEQSEFFPNQQNVGGVSSERELFPVIVSLGKDNSAIPAGTGTVYSREKVLLAPVAPLQAIEGMGSVSVTGLSLLGTNLLATVNGDISTLGTLNLPTVTVGTNLLSSSSLPTFAASKFCTNGTCPGTQISTAHYVTVPTTACAAGTASASCVIQRLPVTISGSKPDCANSGGTAETCSNALFGCSGCYSSATDTFSLNTGSAEFQPGDYVFCNFNVTGGSISANPSASGPVRIYIDSPTSSRCSGDGFTQNGSGVWSGGNFVDTPGINNLLEPTTPTSVLGTTTAPSGLQIYVAGASAHDTTIQIGPSTESTSLQAIYGLVVYAPTSDVSVNVPAACLLTVCTGGVLDGSVIGDTVKIGALTITEDLDIGNYPLYAGVNAFRPVQYIQCSGSVTSLTGTEATDTSGC